MKNKNMKNGKLIFALVLSISMLTIADVSADENNRSAANRAVCPNCPVVAQLQEKSNDIESWMYSTSYWGSISVSELEESDEVINIDNWMFSDDYWGTWSSIEIREVESVNKIEGWMMDNSFWGTINASDVSEGESLNLVENWMGSSNYWFTGLLDSDEVTKVASPLASER